MDYIVIDLEWNQPLSYQSHAYREVGDRLIFEMIQIGAVKMNSSFQITDSISIPIRPQRYTKIHPRIRRMTGLDEDNLAEAMIFQEAMDHFAEWCGEDYALLTWGCDDISVLKQNTDFYHWEGKLGSFYDIQRFFSDVYQCRDRKGLKVAMEMMEIDPEEDKAFHNALNDAYYTALVFAKLPEPGRVVKYSQQAKVLIHQKRFEDAKVKGEPFESVQLALASEYAKEPNCPVCGKRAALEEAGYVCQAADKYVALAKCGHHGALLVRARLQPTEDGRCILGIRVGKAAPSNIAYVHTKFLQVAEKEKEWLESHDELPDPNEALRMSERTSMPFDD